MKQKLYLIIPCYNEEEVIKKTANTLKSKLEMLVKSKQVASDSKILFVNDGSKDNTLNILKDLISRNKEFICLNLTCNVGHQNALLAGLVYSKDFCDVSISLDADLQDDIDVIDEMLEKFYLGNDVVYGVRNSRDADSFFKKSTAEVYYKFLKKMDKSIVYNHADFRLLSKNAMNELSLCNDFNMYLRGIIPNLKFNSAEVYYARKERELGKSKYSIRKMLQLAANGLFNTTTAPIKAFSSIGLILTPLFLILSIVLIFLYAFHTIKDFNFIILSILSLLNSVIILGIGVIGEYIGNIMLDLKKRPKYRISEVIKNEENKKKTTKK